MSCNAWQDLILDALDSPLSSQDQEALQRHLLGCSACRVFRIRQQQLDRSLIKAFPRRALPPESSARLLQLIAQEARSAEARQPSREATPFTLDRPRALAAARAWLLVDAVGYGAVALAGALFLNSLLVKASAHWPIWQRQFPDSRLVQAIGLWVVLSVATGLLLGCHRGLRARILAWVR